MQPLSSPSWKPKACWFPTQVNMTSVAQAWLYSRVLWELLRYDLVLACRGFHGVRPRNRKRNPECSVQNPLLEATVCEAVKSVAPLYWKPIRCLQRSIVTARLMRERGIPAEVVIGYTPVPFFSHAWVEVAGRVVN